MILKLEQHLSENFQYLEHKKIFLAVSGGIDSMVLVHLFQKINYTIGILHCNFQLRKIESNLDMQFVKEYSKKNNLPFFYTEFDTENFANSNKLSIQTAARTLRYEWFNEKVITENYDYIATAHHLDDALETFLINFSRGTGLDGLVGIPEKNNKIIRPLLIFSREEIENYAKKNGIEWREDSSNASNKYLRNKIRHAIIPNLKALNPTFLQSFQNTQKNLLQSQSLVEDATILVYQQVVIDEENQKKISVSQLKKLPNYKAYLYQWLSPFGFQAWDDIYDLIDSQAGKQIFSEKFRLIKDREFLILTPKNNENLNEEYFIAENQNEVKFPLKLSIFKVAHIFPVSNLTIFVDLNKLKFPLLIRKYQKGDVFQPYGMEGRSKKISKFFKDQKLSLIEKEQIWLLCSDNQIIWVVGLRQDERFNVKNNTKQILQISLL